MHTEQTLLYNLFVLHQLNLNRIISYVLFVYVCANGQIGRQTKRHADWQTDGQTERHTDR